MKTMRHKSGEGYSRRMFLAKTSAWGAASFLGLRTAVAAEPPSEVKKIRLVHAPAICLSPQYLAEELLRLEGFSEIQYVDQPMTKSLGPLEAARRT
jgi:NitT/TauT family transport system substrate-binding protein